MKLGYCSSALLVSRMASGSRTRFLLVSSKIFPDEKSARAEVERPHLHINEINSRRGIAFGDLAQHLALQGCLWVSTKDSVRALRRLLNRSSSHKAHQYRRRSNGREGSCKRSITLQAIEFREAQGWAWKGWTANCARSVSDRLSALLPARLCQSIEVRLSIQ